MAGAMSVTVISTVPVSTGMAQQVALPTPEQQFGHIMGADRQLERWDKLVEYYQLLASKSDRVKLVNMGKTTLGNPFLALYISSPENLAKLDEYKAMNAKIADPRGLSQADQEDLVKKSKVVFVQSLGLHSSEVASSQMGPELVYDMLTRNDEEMTRILDETISIIIPALNPDGNVIVTDWYNKTLGTDYEGVGQPTLYHHYIGHDNNRDAYMQNTIESYYGADILFREWIPQAYIDHHQMGAYSARFYVPPYSNPVRPDADPLVWREMSWYGAQIAYKEEEEGKQGVINAAIYSGWGHFGFHWITPFHNTAGMLTESASASLGTPLYVHPDQLKGGRREMPTYEEQTTHPNPWPGGWWRVRDIVEQQKISAIAALDIAAKNREMVLKNMINKGLRQTERGAGADVPAYIIPAIQHDAGARDRLINVLLGQGVEVKKADKAFTHEGRVYQAGTYVVSRAQPKQGVVRWLLGETNYPDNSFTRHKDGSPVSPYDMSTDNIADYFGVRVDEVSSDVTSGLKVVDSETVKYVGKVSGRGSAYVFSGKQNNAFKAMNAAMKAGMNVSRLDQDASTFTTGDFVIMGKVDRKALDKIAAETGVDMVGTSDKAVMDARPLKAQRIAMYQRFYGGNMDEGWTRLLLENHGFDYSSLMSEEIKEGNLKAKYDVIILPNDNEAMLTGKVKGEGYKRFNPENWPEEYRSGFGKEGTENLEEFVEAGGVLLSLGESTKYIIKSFELPIKNVLKGVDDKDFWAPGATLKMHFDASDPLAYGMPKDGTGLFLMGNPAFEVLPSLQNHEISRVATYVDHDVKSGGWLVGEDHITNKASMVSVGHGKGEVVLIGFRPQHRHQTLGTFKLVFNSLVQQP